MIASRPYHILVNENVRLQNASISGKLVLFGEGGLGVNPVSFNGGMEKLDGGDGPKLVWDELVAGGGELEPEHVGSNVNVSKDLSVEYT